MYLLSDFAQNVEVKSYNRLNKGRLVVVKQHSRHTDITSQQDKELRDKVRSGIVVTGALALAGLSLVGISAITKQIIQTRYAQNITESVARIKKAQPITDFKKYSKYNVTDLTNIDKYDNVVIVTGGFTGELGHSANDLRARLARKYRKSLVLAVENREFDTTTSKNIADRVKSLPELLFKSAMKGNQTAEDLAEVAYNVRRQTDKPITFISTSGGGMAVKNAQEITDKLEVKNIQGVGLGSPVFTLSQPKSPFTSIMSGGDLFQFTPKMDKRDIVRVRKTFNTNGLSFVDKLKMMATEHVHTSYLKNQEVTNILDKVINR